MFYIGLSPDLKPIGNLWSERNTSEWDNFGSGGTRVAQLEEDEDKVQFDVIYAGG
jgi:hypothetical protein